jgi:hypothetical protein
MEFTVFPGFWVLLIAFCVIGWVLDIWASAMLKDRLRGSLYQWPPTHLTLYTDEGRRRAIVDRYYWIGGLALIALIVVWNVFT